MDEIHADEIQMAEVQVGADVLYCGECAAWRPFERPPCSDGHGDDCPERICVTCGYAVLIGFVPTLPQPVSATIGMSAAAVPGAGCAGSTAHPAAGRAVTRVMA